jgi:hypothetical protein
VQNISNVPLPGLTSLTIAYFLYSCTIVSFPLCLLGLMVVLQLGNISSASFMGHVYLSCNPSSHVTKMKSSLHFTGEEPETQFLATCAR